MASLRDIKRRIQSVKNTRQITKAMKMVSGAKLKRATDRAVAARPYQESLSRVLGRVAMLSAVEAGLDLTEYTLAEIKRAVVGYGRAVQRQHLPPLGAPHREGA